MVCGSIQSCLLDKIQAIVKEKLQLVGLPGIETTMPNELSGGMKKRVSLARAIAFGPEIIFYDELSWAWTRL